MDWTLLDTLRDKLEFETDLSKIWEYFLDNFGENETFLSEGVPTQDELLLSVMGQIGGALFKTEEIRVEDLMLILLPERSFIHGGCRMQGCLANVLYFTDIQKGVMVVMRSLSSGLHEFARFTTIEMPSPNAFTPTKPTFQH